MGMDPKQIEVECPACNSRLAVDVLTARVVRWKGSTDVAAAGPGLAGGPTVTEEDWDAALRRLSTRKERSTSAFEAAFSKEQARARDLDDLFGEAAELAARRQQQRDASWDRTTATDPLHAGSRKGYFPGGPAADRWRAEAAAARGDHRVLTPPVTDPTARGDVLELAVLPGAEALAAELAAAGYRPTEPRAVWWAAADALGETLGDEVPLAIDPAGAVGSVTLPDQPADLASLADRVRVAAAATGVERVALRGLAIGDQEDALVERGFSVSHHVLVWRRG